MTDDATTVLPPPATTVLVRQPQQRRGRGFAYALLALATIAVFLIALLLASSLLKKGGGEVNTPNVVGQTLAQAQATLAEKGLRLGHVTRKYDNSGKFPAGVIESQDPEPDILLSKGQSVALEVSLGIQMVTVPDSLVGLTQAEAKRALSAVGLKVSQIVPRNSEQPAGQVLQVSPASGTQVPVHSGVQLVVSNGKVEVPKVVGMTVADATQALQQAGFQVQLSPDNASADPTQTHVLSQDPAPGSFAPYGSTVNLQTDAPPPTPTESPSPTESPTESPSPAPSDSLTPVPSPT